MSHPTPTYPAMDAFIDVQVYYGGLNTKHRVSLKPSSTFSQLNRSLCLPKFAGIPIENQKLIYCGNIPRNTDIMAKHNVPSGRFRVCLVSVRSPEELLRCEKAAIEKEKREKEQRKQKRHEAIDGAVSERSE